MIVTLQPGATRVLCSLSTSGLSRRVSPKHAYVSDAIMTVMLAEAEMIPLEIQEQILDYLYDDPVSLGACSLTCSAWLPTTRLHLFRRIKLMRQGDSVRFLCILEPAPDVHVGGTIGGFVHELHLPIMSLHQGGRKAGLRFDLVCRILSHLPDVTSLVIDGFDWYTFLDFFISPGGEADSRGLRSIQCIFRFPSLRTLVMRRIHLHTPFEITQFISMFPRLSTLELARITLHPEWARDYAALGTFASPVGNNPPTGLQELNIDRWTCAPEALRSVAELLFGSPCELRIRKVEWWTLGCNEFMGYSEGSAVFEAFRRASENLEVLMYNNSRNGELDYESTSLR